MTDILLIEDNRLDRQLAERALRGLQAPWAPATVTCAGSWRQAEPLLAERAFALVLLDYKLPDLNGLEILRRLADRPHPPVVMLTVVQELATAIETLRAGAFDYVSKTVDSWGDALCVAVERALEHDRLTRELAASQAQLAAYATDLERRVAARTRELRRTSAELARSNLDLERLAYVASHDLQEPLRRMARHLQLARARGRGRLGPDVDQLMRFAIDGTARMQRLIAVLLDYSQAGQGLETAPVSSAEIVARVVDDLREEIQEAGGVVEVDALPTVHADAVQLARVFQNLIHNGLKFQDGPPWVRVSCERTGDVWTFRVQDNGPGIDAADHERVFEVFRRLPTRVARAGTGMGLSVCRRIVQQHGGTIWVDGQRGTGATFAFTIPVEPAATAASRQALARCESLEAYQEPPRGDQGAEAHPVASTSTQAF